MKKLLQLMAALDINQAEVADELGLSQQTISAYLLRDREIPPPVMLLIKRILADTLDPARG